MLREHFPDYFAEPRFADIQAAAADAPLVYLAATESGGMALIVRPEGAPQAVALLELTEAALNSWLVWTDEAGQNVVGGYLPAQLAVGEWMSAALAQLLPELGEKVMRPLAEALRTSIPSSAQRDEEGMPVTLIPTGRLALLPLHAARYRRDGQEICFLDEFTVTYVPSAFALAEARQRAQAIRGAPSYLIGVGNPLPRLEDLTDLHAQIREVVATLPDDPTVVDRQRLEALVTQPTEELLHAGFALRALVRRLPARLGEPVRRLLKLVERWPLSLPHAKAEVQSIADLLPPEQVETLYEQTATRGALRQRLPRATTFYFSGHGSFNPVQPLRSALHLADGDLTLEEMLDVEFPGLRTVRLAVLSACQTAITDFHDLPEEGLGLPAGFLQAGVPAVVGTLWPVEDASTALLMTRFYEYLLCESLTPAQALRRAQRWLRDLTNAELEAYLTIHQHIAMARRQSAHRMPLALIQELKLRLIIADAPEGRPYTDPYFWAPFIFTGVSEIL